MDPKWQWNCLFKMNEFSPNYLFYERLFNNIFQAWWMKFLCLHNQEFIISNLIRIFFPFSYEMSTSSVQTIKPPQWQSNTTWPVQCLSVWMPVECRMWSIRPMRVSTRSTRTKAIPRKSSIRHSSLRIRLLVSTSKNCFSSKLFRMSKNDDGGRIFFAIIRVYVFQPTTGLLSSFCTAVWQCWVCSWLTTKSSSSTAPSTATGSTRRRPPFCRDSSPRQDSREFHSPPCRDLGPRLERRSCRERSSSVADMIGNFYALNFRLKIGEENCVLF